MVITLIFKPRYGRIYHFIRLNSKMVLNSKFTESTSLEIRTRNKYLYFILLRNNVTAKLTLFFATHKYNNYLDVILYFFK